MWHVLSCINSLFIIFIYYNIEALFSACISLRPGCFKKSPDITRLVNIALYVWLSKLLISLIYFCFVQSCLTIIFVSLLSCSVIYYVRMWKGVSEASVPSLRWCASASFSCCSSSQNWSPISRSRKQLISMSSCAAPADDDSHNFLSSCNTNEHVGFSNRYRDLIRKICVQRIRLTT